MKIAITGANSFIGMKLVEKTCLQGWQVVAVVREGKEAMNDFQGKKNLSVCGCNMENYDHLGELVGRVDCFVHLSWNGTRGESRMEEKRQYNNYVRSMEAIRSMIKSGCDRVLTAGSQAEYGIYDGLITENIECRPNTAYGKYKFKLYEDAYELCRENDVTFKEPRFFSLYGPGDYKDTVIMKCIRNMQDDIPCKLTKAVQMWDYLYIDDAIDAVIMLCEKKCRDGAYNFGSGDCRRLKDYIEEIKVILNSKSELQYGQVAYPPTGMVSIQPDIKKITGEVGWKAVTTFKQGICNILNCKNFFPCEQ